MLLTTGMNKSASRFTELPELCQLLMLSLNNLCYFLNVVKLLLHSIFHPLENIPSLVAHVLFVYLVGFGDGKYVSFEDRQWHQPCFKCSRCSVSLVGSGFFPDRDQILCTDCNNDE